MVFAVLLIDADGVVVQANPSSEEMLGLSASRLVGRKFDEIVRVEDPRVEREMAEGNARLIARHVETEIESSSRVINLTSSPLATHRGWRVITLSDIGQGEAAFDHGQSAASTPSILAHEIKNPLAAIKGASQLLERRSEENNRSLARMIIKEVDRIAYLIDRMQQLGSRTALQMENCNVHEIARSALGVIRASRNSQITFREEFDPSLPEVQVDREALRQVLINLLANACETLENNNDRQIEIRTRYESGFVFSAFRLGQSTKLPIEISIIDNGPGIPQDLQSRIFDPFFSTKRGGQGLGLALVAKLVADMGGRIDHFRDNRNGTTNFRVNLPVAKLKTHDL
ncbi:PAS domain S-box protein [Erythrobacter litoralis]|nr:PAS domain S-box protein [Erythrobacter litoralis]